MLKHMMVASKKINLRLTLSTKLNKRVIRLYSQTVPKLQTSVSAPLKQPIIAEASFTPAKNVLEFVKQH